MHDRSEAKDMADRPRYKASKATDWFESRTRRIMVGYLWGSLIFLAALMVLTVGMGIYALVTA